MSEWEGTANTFIQILSVFNALLNDSTQVAAAAVLHHDVQPSVYFVHDAVVVPDNERIPQFTENVNLM